MGNQAIVAEGERALAELADKIASVPDDAVVRPHNDPHAAAVTAILVADWLGQPHLASRLEGVGIDGAAARELGRMARAIAGLVTDLGGEYLPDAVGVPGDLVQRGHAVRGAAVKEIETALMHDLDAELWIEAVRLGDGVVDLVYDLRTLAELHDKHAGELREEVRKMPGTLRAAADAIEFALRAGESPEHARARSTIGRLWAMFVPAYERAAAAGRALTKGEGKEQSFPPLALVAAHRRARRRPVSLVPPARPSAPPPSGPSSERAAAITGEVEVIRSEPPPPPPATESTKELGERQSWSESRKKQRTLVELEVGVGSESNFYVGFTENLSVAGVFVATYVQKPIGSKVEIALTMPGGERLTVPGVVRWQRAATSDGWPGIGIEFETLSKDDAARIQKFLELRDPLFYAD